MNFEVDNKTEYKSVCIGRQIWMAEDLHVTTYRNGDPVCQATDDEEWIYLCSCGIGAFYCHKINNNTHLLYNGYAINDLRGLAPEGWQIPTVDDWQEMIVCLGGKETAGGKMKDVNSKSWKSPNIGATNSSGFTSIGVGTQEIFGGGNYLQGHVVGYWAKKPSKEENITDTHVYLLRHDITDVLNHGGLLDCGEAARCIKK